MPRQKLSQPEAFIPGPESKADRNRDWDKRRRSGDVCQIAFRNVPVEIRAELKAIAAHHLITMDELGRFALEYFVQQVQSKEVEIETTPRLGKHTLYPNSKNGR